MLVDSNNPEYTSVNGILYSYISDEGTGAPESTNSNNEVAGSNANDGTLSLLLVPEGMEGAAVLPEKLATVPACVFSRTLKLPAILYPTGSTAPSRFSTWNGVLYTADKTTLLAAPAGIGASVAIAPECTAIAEGAFWGNKNLETIVVNGDVREIELGNASSSNVISTEASVSERSGEIFPAFNSETVASATVILPADSSRTAWEEAGFTHFADAVEPGMSVVIDGLLYTLLNDYTLSVALADKTESASSGAGKTAAQLGEPGGERTASASNTGNVIKIPETANISGIAYTVSTVADDGFAASTVTSVELPDTVRKIGTSAFKDCAGLESITLGTNLEILGAHALRNTALSELVLPASLQTIGDEALGGLSGTTIVAKGTPGLVAISAMAGSTGCSIYVPYQQSENYPFNAGLPAAGNSLYPYALDLSSDPLQIELEQQGELFEGATLKVPFKSDFEFSYKANSFSVDEGGTVKAHKIGTGNVTASLVLNLESETVTLDAGTRTVDVILAELPEEEVVLGESGEDDTQNDTSQEGTQESENAIPSWSDYTTIAKLPCELNEETVESLEYETADGIPMTNALMKLDLEANDNVVYAASSVMYIRSNRTNAKYTSQSISGGTWTDAASAVTPDSNTINASTAANVGWKVNGQYIESNALRGRCFYTYSGSDPSSGTSITFGRIYNVHWSYTASATSYNKIPDGTTFASMSTSHSVIYAIFPEVTLNANSISGSDGDLLYTDYKDTLASRGKSFVEQHPTWYYTNGTMITRRDVSGTTATSYWRAKLNGVMNEGWSDTKSGEPLDNNVFISQYNFKTIYAVYPEYKVFLNNQGGTGGDTSVSVRLGQSMPKITVPTKSGYDFMGYFSGTNGTGTQYYNSAGNGYASDIATNNKTLYACWRPHVFEIDLDYFTNAPKNVVGELDTAYTKYLTLYGYKTSSSSVVIGLMNPRTELQYTTPVVPLELDDEHFGPAYLNDDNAGWHFTGFCTGQSPSDKGYRILSHRGELVYSSFGYLIGSNALDGDEDRFTLYAHYSPDVVMVDVYHTSNTGWKDPLNSSATNHFYVRYNDDTYSDVWCTDVMSRLVPADTADGYKLNGYYTAVSGGTRLFTSSGYSDPKWNWNFDESWIYDYFFDLPSTQLLGSGDPSDTHNIGKTSIYAQYGANVTQVTLNKTSNTGAATTPGGTSTLWVKYSSSASYTTNKYSNSACTTSLTSVTVPKTKVNYRFDGYYTAATGGTQYIDKDGKYTSDFKNTVYPTDSKATLYAHYTCLDFSVTFDPNKPSAASSSVSGTMSPQTFTYGTNKNLTEKAYSLKGWSFIGWNTKADGSGTAYGDQAVFSGTAGATTLYAQWKQKDDYTISFNSNEATSTTGSQTASKTATYDALLPAISTTAPERTGYTFMGWYDNADYTKGNQYYTSACVAVTNKKYQVDGNITLYAGWSPNTDTKYFVEHWVEDANSDEYILMENDECYGTTGTEVRAEYRSSSTWIHTTTANSKESGVIAGDGSLVLKVYYNLARCTVKFNANGGLLNGESVHEEQFKYGQVIDLRGYEPRRDGYYWGGWNTRQGLSSGSYQPYTVLYDEEMTAKWTARSDTNYDVQHYRQKVDGSYELFTTKTYEGTTDSTVNATLLTQSELPGFHHTRVSGDKTSGVVTAGSTKLVLKVYYDQNTYNIAFDGNNSDGGTVPAAKQNIKYEEVWSIPTAEQPTRTGYRMLGWKNATDESDTTTYVAGRDYSRLTTQYSSGSTPTVTLQAVWDAKPYTILLDANGGNPSGTISTHYDEQWTISTAQVPTRRGYNFMGWAKNKSDSMTADFVMPPSGDFTVPEAEKNLWDGNGETGMATLFAVWQPKLYTVVFEANAPDDGIETTGAVPDPLNALFYDQTTEIPAYGHASDNNLLRHKGYSVIGWSTNADDTKEAKNGIWYTHGEQASNIGLAEVADDAIGMAPVKLYAIWAPMEYTIAFVKGEGDYITNDGGQTQQSVIMVNVTYGSPHTIVETGVRGGFEFVGWQWTDSKGTLHTFQVGEQLSDLTDDPTENFIVMYPIWKGSPYRVYFDANGATGQMWTSDSNGKFTNDEGVEFFWDEDRGLYYTEYNFGITGTLPTCNFSRTGYSFAGWTSNLDDPANASNFGNKQLILDIPPEGANEITLHAFWEAQLNITAPIAAVLRADMDGVSGLLEGRPVVDISKDEPINAGKKPAFVSNTPEDTFVSYVTCAPVEAGLRSVFPNATYTENSNGSKLYRQITIGMSSSDGQSDTYYIGNGAGYRVGGSPYFRIPKMTENGTAGSLEMDYTLSIDPALEMNFFYDNKQIANLIYEIELVEKLDLGIN